VREILNRRFRLQAEGTSANDRDDPFRLKAEATKSINLRVYRWPPAAGAVAGREDDPARSFQFITVLNTMLNSPWFCHR
jgi:hypothetical protein